MHRPRTQARRVKDISLLLPKYYGKRESNNILNARKLFRASGFDVCIERGPTTDPDELPLVLRVPPLTAASRLEHVLGGFLSLIEVEVYDGAHLG